MKFGQELILIPESDYLRCNNSESDESYMDDQ